MSAEKDIVYLYIFDANDGRTTNEKIIIAVEEYAKLYGISVLSNPEVHRTPKGKPYIAGDTNIGVSVSHSGEWFVCALTDGNVGVDIEQHQAEEPNQISETENRFLQIAGRFFHPQETAFIAQDPLHRFYMIWTAKECYVKYTGTGMDETLGDHSVISATYHGVRAEALPKEWTNEEVYFRQMSYESEYTVSICKANAFDIEIKKMK